MGLLDKASPCLTKALVAGLIACISAIFVAMCVTAPSGEAVTGGDLSALVAGDQAWILTSTALVLLMTPGVGFFYGGMVQHKNVVATIIQACIPMAIIPIVWSVVGFGLAFAPSVPGSAGILGDPAKTYGLMYNVGANPDPDLAPTIPVSLYFLFQLVFAICTPALIIGSVADRVNVSSLSIFIALWHIVVYCPLAHMVWHPTGLIRTFGVLDFAGGTVVHMSSGFAGLAAAKYLGHSLRAPVGYAGPDQHEPANVPYVILGAAILWFGWFGFNAGSCLSAGPLTSHTFMTTNTATALAMITWMLMDIIRGKKMRATGAAVGAVVGLVAITPAAGVVNVGASALIGIIGAVVCAGAQEVMERFGRKYVDDTLDVFACHGIGGTVGMICTSLFATTSVNPAGGDGAFYGNPLLLGKTLLVLVLIVPWFLTFTWGCLWVTDQILALRASDEEILEGLDVSKHGERAFYAITDASQVVPVDVTTVIEEGRASK